MRFIGALSKAAAAAAGWILCGLAVYLSASVFLRYFLNAPLPFSDEISTLLLLAVVYLALPDATRQGEQISTDFLLVNLPPRVQAGLRLLTLVLGLVFAIAITAGGVRLVLEYWTRQTMPPSGLQLPLYWPALVIPAGAAIMVLVIAVQLRGRRDE